MGKFSTKKDSFFIGKKQKNVGSVRAQKFVNKSHSFDKSASGSFFIKSTEKADETRTKPTDKFRRFDPKSGKRKEDTEIKQSDKPKRTFDKKKWRLQKYSKKYKLEQWEERRKKSLLTDYYKQVENEPKFDVQKIYEKYADAEEDDDSNENQFNCAASKSSDKTPDSEASSSATQGSLIKSAVKTRMKAHDQFEKKREEKKQKRLEMEKKKAEKAEAIKAYKQKKLEKYKKLNKKTKKGQPIMKYRMEMLLDQIQKSTQL